MTGTQRTTLPPTQTANSTGVKIIIFPHLLPVSSRTLPHPVQSFLVFSPIAETFYNYELISYPKKGLVFTMFRFTSECGRSRFSTI